MNGRLVTPDGSLDGSAYAIAATTADEWSVDLAAGGSDGLWVVWTCDTVLRAGHDVNGRLPGRDGRPPGEVSLYAL